jgi:hypothetical protein
MLRKQRGLLGPLFSGQLLFCRIQFDDLSAFIETAGPAGPVGQTISTALGAGYYAGGLELPVRIAPLISSCF